MYNVYNYAIVDIICDSPISKLPMTCLIFKIKF
jgi:hypothetical protein